MSPQYAQRNRQIAVSTPLEEDTLLLRAVSGRQSLSRPFRFKLDLLSEDSSIPFDAIVGKPVTIRVGLDGHEWFWNGIVSQFAHGGRFQELWRYEATVVPWLWLLTRNRDCRIFQNKSVPTILQDIFQQRGFRSFDFRLYGDFAKREYCVQYRESDFHFVSRLMEEEGIYYFFEHENGKHTLVLANDPAAHRECSCNPLLWHDVSTGGHYPGECVVGWKAHHQVRTGEISLTDYNPQQPSPSLHVQRSTDQPWRIHDYPGHYATRMAGDRAAKLRLQEQRAGEVVHYGATTCPHLAPGHKLALDAHYRPDLNGPYLVTSMYYPRREADEFRSDNAHVPAYYVHEFTCVPADRPYGPRRTTRRPFIRGCQTAVVVGPEKEEIHTDKHARVKVRFHWDVEPGKRDEDRSCWIRVAQPWAGKTWGFFALPRIGHEVVVTFLEGNPDRPLITGSVYNGHLPPPYGPTERREMTGLKSNSTKGGGGYNEFVITDVKGSELIRVHAQKDMETTVLNDQKEIVKRHKNVHVLQELRTQVDQKVSATFKGDLAERFAQNHAELVGAERYLKANRIIIEAAEEICLKVGGNHVTISSGGVYVDGAMVDLNCGHPALSTALSGLTPDAPAASASGEGAGASKAASARGSKAASAGAAAAVMAAAAGSKSATPSLVAISSPRLRQFEHAKQMALLANDVYNSRSSLPSGFERVSDDPSSLPTPLQDPGLFHDPSSGFDAALYKAPDGHVVLAYRGTEPGSAKDWWSDVKQAFGFHSEQQEEAIRLAKRVKKAYPPPPEVEITGHSLGGGLAALASAATGMQATTFNAAGVNSKTLREYDVSGTDLPVTNYTVSGEVLTTVQNWSPLPQPLGKQVELPPPPGIAGTPYLVTGMATGAPGVAAEAVARHSMQSVMSSLDTSIAQEKTGG